MTQFWSLIADTFRESRDRKIFWVIVGISALTTVAMLCIGFYSDHISLAFWDISTTVCDPTTEEGQANIALIAVSVVDLLLGFMGMLLAIIATAGIFPSMMEPGSIDVLLSKPMSRPTLFLARYVGALVFILAQAVIFVVPTFFVIGLRWHTWIPAYLLTIPLMVLLFSYLYCVSVWAAVWTRSALTAVLLALGAWMLFGGVQTTCEHLDLNYPRWKENRVAYHALETARWVFPKTADVTYLAHHWCNSGTGAAFLPEPASDGRPDPMGLTAEERRSLNERTVAVEKDRRQVSPIATIGSSLAFEAVVVFWAMWRFSRKDF